MTAGGTGERARSAGPGGLLPQAAEFQSEPTVIERTPPPVVARATLYALAALLVVAGIFSALANLDSIITARGRLITKASNIVIAPLETAVVRAIEVSVGDRVSEGQILARLDPTFTEADAAMLGSRVAGLEAQIARVEAELNAGTYTGGPRPEQDLQRRLFVSRAEQYAAQIEAFKAAAAALEAQRRTRQRDLELLRAQLEVLREVEEMRTTLAERGSGSRVNALDARAARLDVERSAEQAANSLVEIGHELARVRADRAAFVNDWQRQIAEALEAARQDLAEAREALAKAERRKDLVELASPTDATVLEVGEVSVGTVLQQADTLMTLVPVNVPLEVEANVRAQDIGQVLPGDEVRIKLDAFPFQKHGTLDGTVRVVSEDAFSPGDRGQPGAGQGEPVYRVRIALTDTTLDRVPDRFRLISGMTVAAEIKVGQRSVLSYLLYPLSRGLDEALREP